MHVVANVFDLSLMETVREEFERKRQQDLAANPSSRFQPFPLQMLQIILADAETFSSSGSSRRLEEVLLLLTAYLIYFIDDGDSFPLCQSLDGDEGSR